MIEAEAIRQGVPVSIALAVAEQESNFNQAARGSSGEIGVFQLMPATAGGLGVDPFKLDQNIVGGITYLSQQFSKFGNWDEALAAYNAGPGKVTRGTIPSSTHNYVNEVFARLPKFTTASVDYMPTFTVDVFDSAPGISPWLLAMIGIGVGSMFFLTVKR